MKPERSTRQGLSAPGGEGPYRVDERPPRPSSYPDPDGSVKPDPQIRHIPTPSLSRPDDGPPLDPYRFALGQSKMITALRAAGRELTQGEITNYVLSSSSWRPAQRREILDGLVAEGRIAFRDAPMDTTPCRVSRFYRLSPEGGER